MEPGADGDGGAVVLVAGAGIGLLAEKQPVVYIMASGRNGTLYTSVTSDLIRRIYLHRSGEVEGFTARYNVKRLVWFEVHGMMEPAIVREKRIKAWKRQWKIDLIEKENPLWRDLAEDFGFDPLDE